MEQRLTPAQLEQVVAEAQRMALQDQDLIDREQVRQILTELNLPPDSLEEAMAQVERRQALAQEKRKIRRIVTAGIAALVVAIAIPSILVWQHQQTIAPISAQQSRLTLAQDNGEDLPTIPRQPTELYYRVTLKDAPIGKKLSLSCDWMDPKNQVVKQNRYETKEVTTTVWNTQCRYAIAPTVPPGKWSVKMFLEGRQISEKSFEVK